MCKHTLDLLAAAKALLELAEAQEEQIEGEWGSFRSLERIESDGELPEEILNMRAAVQKMKVLSDGICKSTL